MASDTRRALICIAALLVLSLACSIVDRFFDAYTPRLPISEEILPALEECDGSAFLTAESIVTKDEVNSEGTRLCEYKVVITNDSPTTTIFAMVRVHTLDGYHDLDEVEWMMPGAIPPLSSKEWAGYVFTYNDPDASGPVARVAERMTGTLDSPECVDARVDDSTLDLYSVAVEPGPCAMPAGP